MELIIIKIDDVVKRMEETFIETVREVANEKYTEEKEQELMRLIRKGLENTSPETYINAICMQLSEEMISGLNQDR